MSDDLSGFSLLELFRTEAEGNLATLTEGLLALEGRGGDAATVEPLMRAAHSLKGAARIVGLTDAERLAHAMEDVFVAAQKGAIRLRPDQIDALLAAVDRLGRIALGTEPESAGPELDAAYWYASLRSPVEFDRAIRVLAGDGYHTFVETSPHPVLTGAITDTLEDAGVTAPLQVMQSRGGLAASPIARQRPVRLFLSGPAAGVIGGLEVGLAAGFRDQITVDIGGTSCDIIKGSSPTSRARCRAGSTMTGPRSRPP